MNGKVGLMYSYISLGVYLTSLFGLNGWASYLVTLKGLVGFEKNFNGRYFHHNFCVKTGVRFFCVLSGTRDLQCSVTRMLYTPIPLINGHANEIAKY